MRIRFRSPQTPAPDHAAADVPPSGNLERELRFSLTAEGAIAFADLPLFAKLTAPRNFEFQNTYFDLPSFKLAKAGCSLRIRQGTDILRQTLKVPLHTNVSDIARLELEREVTTATPSLLPEELKHLPRKLQTRLKHQALLQVYQTQYRRQSWQVPYGASVIEISLDRGEINSGNSTWPICEVELELKRGNQHDLYALAISLCDQCPLAVLDESKSARGARIAQSKKAKIRFAEPVKLERRMQIGAVFAALAQECQTQYAANRLAFLEHGEAEAVHQMRVALRRLWALVWVFKPLVEKAKRQEISNNLQALRQRLGPARGAQVFAHELLPQVASPRSKKSLWSEAHEFAAKRVGEKHKLLATEIADSDHASHLLHLRLNLLELERLISSVQPGRPTLRSLLRHQLRKLHGHFAEVGGHCPPPTSPAFHQLRLSLKKQRYVAEMFSAQFKAGKLRRHIKQLENLQLFFGEMNDVFASAADIAALCQAAQSTHGKEWSELLQRHLLAWRARRLKKDEKKLKSLHSQLKELEPLWSTLK